MAGDKKNKKQKFRITEVKAKSVVKAKPLNIEEFEGEAPEDDEEKEKTIARNIIGKVGE